MKRVFAGIVVLLLLLSLMGCAKTPEDETAASGELVEDTNVENDVQDMPQPQEPDKETEKKPDEPQKQPTEEKPSAPEQETPSEQPEEKPVEEKKPVEQPEEKAEEKPEEQAPATDAVNPLDVLTNAWNAMGDEEKFPIGGGDSANMVMDAPGAFDIASVEELDALLGLSADGAAKIDAAASLMHMMNANTFTCGAYSVVAGEDVSAFITALKDNIQARQWMCGFPEKLVIVTVDNVVVSMFGNAQIIDSFTAKLGGTVVVDEAIQ